MTREYSEYPMVGVGVACPEGGGGLTHPVGNRRAKVPESSWRRQELGETTREAGVREVLEETGLEIEIKDLIDVVDTINRDDNGCADNTPWSTTGPNGYLACHSGHRCRRARWVIPKTSPTITFGTKHTVSSPLGQGAQQFLTRLKLSSD